MDKSKATLEYGKAVASYGTFVVVVMGDIPIIGRFGRPPDEWFTMTSLVLFMIENAILV